MSDENRMVTPAPNRPALNEPILKRLIRKQPTLTIEKSVDITFP
jgi:hypothetical protein